MYRTAYRTVDAGGLSVFHRQAGLPGAPTIRCGRRTAAIESP